jgi:hypothetical protein
MKFTLRISAVILLVFAFNTLVLAQSSATGDLRVTVRDEKGSLITTATVTARDQARGIERSTTLNTDGEYRILQLPPGTYAVSVEASGFGKTDAPDISVTVGQARDLPITLKVAGGQTIIEVGTDPALVETTRSQTTNTVEQRQIDNLPINGRNYINFALTDSQVTRDNAPNIGAAPTSGLNISGQRARSNLVNVDGADAIDNSTNGVRSTVSQEAVQEFQIVTNSYTAEYGRASGGVVNIITRSGTNNIHGDLYGYLRNRKIQAVNPFSTESDPAYTRVQSGVALGGPIKKDKTWYYFSYELTRRHETGFASIGQNGFGLIDFDATSMFAPPGTPPGTLMMKATPDQAAFLGNGALPLGLRQQYAFLAGGSSGIALNGSYPVWFVAVAPTPTNGTSPLSQFPTSCNPSNTLCNGLPASFLSLNSQVGNFPVFERTDLYSLRLDHNVSNSNRLMLRGNVSPSRVTGIEVNGQNQTFGQNAFSRTSAQDYHDWAVVAQDTQTFGNNKINEFRFQYARRGLSYFYNSAPGGSNAAINIPGFAFFGREPYSYIERTEERYQIVDNFSISKGRHDIKFGGDYNYIPISATFTVNYGAVINFGGLEAARLGFPSGLGIPAFSPVQAYGLGIPSSYIQGIGNPRNSFKNQPLGLFFQDAWKIKPNLTLNYGVRYDIEFPPTFAAPSGLAQGAYNQLGLQKGIKTDKNNFQPRIGLAWDPHGDGKSVFRASYGIFYDHPLLGLYFLGDASDGSKSGQLLFVGGSPCGPNPAAASPANLNASNIFQGILATNGCLPGADAFLGYLPNEQRFDAFLPNSLFIDQNYLKTSPFFPLGFQPFGYPQGKGFVYAYSQQINLSFERDLGAGYALSLAYNYNGGRHINRPINANTARGDLLVKNWQAAVATASSPPYNLTPDNPNFPSNPLFVGTSQAFPACGISPTGQPYVPAALVNFFRPSGLNPSLAQAYAPCVPLANQVVLKGAGLNSACDPSADPTALDNCVPFSDMDANFSNGSSVYHGFTANLKKRFSNHYEFLASYTWSHSIDDSTDLQSPLAPQDSFSPFLERSNSTFDQRHRLVFSGVFQTGSLPGGGFWRRLASNWSFSPLIEVASGRPFNILTAENTNFQFSPNTARPKIVPSGTPGNACGPTVASPYSPTGAYQLPCFIDGFGGATPAEMLLSLDGTLGRNSSSRPWTVFNDLGVAKRIYFGERVNLEARADMFNIANRFNVADVNVLWTDAGRATSAYDARQFQFAVKLHW